MTLDKKIKLQNASIKLKRVMGTPPWLTRVVGVENGDGSIALEVVINKMLSPEEIKYEIPFDVDMVDIQIYYEPRNK